MSRHLFSRSATAKAQPVVCVGDMHSHQFSVSEEEITEKVTKTLRENPDLPGVILLKGRDLTGMIPRRRIFERLGQRYGIELFLRKKISLLHRDMCVETPLVATENLRVEELLFHALQRPTETVYNPVVIKKDECYGLVDMQTLIMEQANLLTNLNSTMKTLNEFESMADEEEPDIALSIMVDALRGVVPFHHLNIFVLGKKPLFYGQLPRYIDFFEKDISHYRLHKMPFSFDQTICMEDINGIENWQNVTDKPKQTPRAWMSTPLKNRHQHQIGSLSIYRYAHTPFTKNETELATTFAKHLGRALNHLLELNFPSLKGSSPNSDFSTDKKQYAGHPLSRQYQL